MIYPISRAALILSALAISSVDVVFSASCTGGKIILTPSTFTDPTSVFGPFSTVVNTLIAKLNPPPGASEFVPVSVLDGGKSYIEFQDGSDTNSENAVWHTVPICASLAQKSFYMSFTFKYRSVPGVLPSDGIAVALQTDGPNVVGDYGYAIGLENEEGHGNITKAVGLEAHYFPNYNPGVTIVAGKMTPPDILFGGASRGILQNYVFQSDTEYTLQMYQDASTKKQTVTLTSSTGQTLLQYVDTKDLSSVLDGTKDVYFGVTSGAGYFQSYLFLKQAAFGAAATVASDADLAKALADGIAYINVAPGTYTAPAGGFQVTAPGTNLNAKDGGVTINCIGNTGFGLNVVAPDVYVSKITVSNCGTGIQSSSDYAQFDDVTVSGNSNNVGVGSGFHILKGSTLISNSFVKNNNGPAAIYALGTVTVDNTDVDGNSGDGIRVRYEAGILSVTRSRITNNYGSGIYGTDGSYLGVTSSTISGNHGGYYGGGVGVVSSRLYVAKTTIANNQASKNGGGIYIEGASAINHYDYSDNVVLQSNTPQDFYKA